VEISKKQKVIYVGGGEWRRMAVWRISRSRNQLL